MCASIGSSECDRCMLDAQNNKLVFICKAPINTVRINMLVWFVATFAPCSHLINEKVHEINGNCYFFVDAVVPVDAVPKSCAYYQVA